LRDFLYDNDLLGHEEVDEKALSGLRGVVKISHTTVNGTSLLNLDGFAPASQWEALSAAPSPIASTSTSPEAPGVEKEGVLPDVHPRAPAAAGATGTEAGWMVEGIGVGEGGAEGRAAVRLCKLVAQSPGDAL
jgi:hypothetical protein